MKISIVGGGNMGSAIALGLADSKKVSASDITVINRRQSVADSIKDKCNEINAVVGDYSSIENVDILILAIKPWLIEEFLGTYKKAIKPSQIILSVAAGISLEQLSRWTYPQSPVYRVIPNTAVAVRQSMTFITSANATKEEDMLIKEIFDELGQTMFIEEKTVPAVTSLSSCGIAFAFRYIRAAIVGGIEMGIYPEKGQDIMIQTLRGAIELLETNKSHPEAEIDKVTTPGGITIKGLNEMEHAGFTSSVIRGLKASNIK